MYLFLYHNFIIKVLHTCETYLTSIFFIKKKLENIPPYIYQIFMQSTHNKPFAARNCGMHEKLTNHAHHT